MVFWLTGLSGSGKTTLAGSLADRMRKAGLPVLFLDGDEARASLCKGLGFSLDDRTENVRRIAACAALAEKSGIISCVACISPLARQRELARGMLASFHEIYLDCGLDICRQRDPKGNYKRAQAGALDSYTGIASPYEAPLQPELVLRTGAENLEESKRKLFNYVGLTLIKAGLNPATGIRL